VQSYHGRRVGSTSPGVFSHARLHPGLGATSPRATLVCADEGRRQSRGNGRRGESLQLQGGHMPSSGGRPASGRTPQRGHLAGTRGVFLGLLGREMGQSRGRLVAGGELCDDRAVENQKSSERFIWRTGK